MYPPDTFSIPTFWDTVTGQLTSLVTIRLCRFDSYNGLGLIQTDYTLAGTRDQGVPKVTLTEKPGRKDQGPAIVTCEIGDFFIINTLRYEIVSRSVHIADGHVKRFEPMLVLVKEPEAPRPPEPFSPFW